MPAAGLEAATGFEPACQPRNLSESLAIDDRNRAPRMPRGPGFEVRLGLRSSPEAGAGRRIAPDRSLGITREAIYK